MKNGMPSPKIIFAALLSTAMGLMLGFAPEGDAIVTPTMPAANGCTSGGGLSITSIERVDIGLTSETFLVKWDTIASCVNGFEVKIEAGRQNGGKRSDEKKFGPNERSGLLKVFGARRDNLAEVVTATVTSTAVLAGRGTGTLGQTVVATAQPVTAATPVLTIQGAVFDDNQNLIPDVKIGFSEVASSKGSAIVPGSASGGSVQVPQSVVTDSRGNYRQTGFQTGKSFRVTPSKPGFTFRPTSALITIGNTDRKVDFTAIPPQTFSAAGQVRTQSGANVPDATIAFSLANPADVTIAVPPGPVKSSANGAWSQSGFVAGIRYIVTVRKTGVRFDPNQATIEKTLTNLNFIGQ